MPRPQISLKARALRYLAAREHSRQELARKLSRYAQEGDDIEALLDSLEAANFQSQERFSESLVNRRSARFGNSRILAELQTHGIEADKLDIIKQQLAEDEVQRACDVWRRKFGVPPADPAEKARQMRFLQQRGFSHKAIQVAIKQAEATEE
jgi:regulatory protein